MLTSPDRLEWTLIELYNLRFHIYLDWTTRVAFAVSTDFDRMPTISSVSTFVPKMWTIATDDYQSILHITCYLVKCESKINSKTFEGQGTEILNCLLHRFFGSIPKCQNSSHLVRWNKKTTSECADLTIILHCCHHIAGISWNHNIEGVRARIYDGNL